MAWVVSHKQKLWENMVHIFSRIHPILDVDLLILILDSSHGGVSTLSPSSLAFLLAIIPSFMRFWRQTVYFMLADLSPDCREHSACADFPHCTKSSVEFNFILRLFVSGAWTGPEVLNTSSHQDISVAKPARKKCWLISTFLLSDTFGIHSSPPICKSLLKQIFSLFSPALEPVALTLLSRHFLK